MVFCPEFRGRRPLKISPPEWEDVGVFLFGPASLPDLDWAPSGREEKEQESESINETRPSPRTRVVKDDTTEDPDGTVTDGHLTAPNTTSKAKRQLR